MAHLGLLLVVVSIIFFAHALEASGYPAYDYGFDVKKRLKRQLGGHSALIVQDKTGGEIQLRQEIRQLEKDTDLWTLYILGLSMMQFTDQSSPASYYAIAGIHGMPHQTWGGVKPVPGGEDTGYCTHSSVLFPTWHRPYMALYEQILHGMIEMIATFYPAGERQRYQEAARRFRLPYWDWALSPPPGESVLPTSIGGSPYVDINGPNGLQRIANPLFSYTFKPLNTTAFGSGPWNYWTRTLRSPSSNDPDAQSNNSRVAMDLDQNRASISQRLYALFSSYDNYTTFSNNAHGAQADSIESLHDTIHSLVGGLGPVQASSQPGHMAYIQWSAFDPVFFLHHCMVDRILAMWQAIHPDAWVVPTRALMSSYTTRRGQIQDSSTALTPFFSSENGTFWTSDGVRDHTRFGYTYPELVRGQMASSNMARTRTAKQAVNRLYGSFSPANLFLKELRAQGLKGGRGTAVAGTGRSAGLRPRSSLKGKIFTDDHYQEWVANVWVGKPALDDGTLSIHFFLGDPPSDPLAWTSAPNHVGTMGVFATAKTAGKGGPSGELVDHHNVPISGTVPLTAALMEKIMAGELESLEQEHVEPYLRENLKKKVLGPNGGEVTSLLGEEGGKKDEGKCVQGIQIQVVSSLVAAPYDEEELPEWGEPNVRFEMC